MNGNQVDDRDTLDSDRSMPSSSSLAAVDGDASSLYQFIVRDKVWGANLDPPESAKNVIKPWHQRLSADECTQSNVDDQMAITVPFTCPVRVKSIIINTGTGDFAPTRCRAFINRPDGIDFDEAEQSTSSSHPSASTPFDHASTLGPLGSGKAQADFALLQSHDGVVEYPVSVARFSNTNTITIILSHSNSGTLSRFFYLGFRGTALVLNKEPGERLHIAAANAADRPVDGLKEKRGASQGLAGGASPGHHKSPRYTVKDSAAAQQISRMASASATSPGSPRRSPRSILKHPSNNQNLSTTSPSASRTPARASETSPSKRKTPAALPTRTPRTEGARIPTFPSPVKQASGRRSLSQPPPSETLVRQLKPNTPKQASSSVRTPSQKSAHHGLSTTPGKRLLGTPRQAPSSAAANAASQTPATEKRKSRNEALLASAQRTREKRNPRKSAWGGLGTWASGREESPMDILRRLARAPGFVAPPTPSEDSIAMPPPALPERGARDSMASTSARSSLAGRSSLGSRASRATMLVPGESIPGDLTRDSTSDSADMDESLISHSGLLSEETSRISDLGIPRRKSGVGIASGGIFAALADRNKTSRMSSGSRVSFADPLSPDSGRFDEMSDRREDDLERSLAHSATGADSFALTAGLDHVTSRAMERLDELTRKNFFGDDGHLHLDAGDSSAESRRNHVRSMSEPIDTDQPDYDDLGGGPDFGDGFDSEEDEVSDALAVEDDNTDPLDDEIEEGGAPRNAQTEDTSLLSDSRSRTDLLNQNDLSANQSQLSQQFDDSAQASFQVDDPYSDEEDAEYGIESVNDMEEDIDDDDADDIMDKRDASVKGLDLMNPKDLNALLKRRIVKKRKARVSPYSGAAVPPLPASVMRDMFSSLLSPGSSVGSGASLLTSGARDRASKRVKLDSTVLDELDSACHDFFGQFAQNIMSQSKVRTSRKSSAKADAGTTITEADVVAVLKQQGHVTPRHDASSLAYRLLPRELTDQMNLSRWAKAGTVQTTLASMLGSRKARKGAGKSNPDDTNATSVADNSI